jgi:hypothetical protein
MQQRYSSILKRPRSGIGNVALVAAVLIGLAVLLSGFIGCAMFAHAIFVDPPSTLHFINRGTTTARDVTIVDGLMQSWSLGDVAPGSSAALEFRPNPEMAVFLETGFTSDDTVSVVVDHFPDSGVSKRYEVECVARADGGCDLFATERVMSSR